MSPVTLLGLQHSALFAVGLFARGRSWPNDGKCRQNDGVPRARAHRYLVRRARPELAQSARASRRDRISAFGSAAGELHIQWLLIGPRLTDSRPRMTCVTGGEPAVRTFLGGH